jgi:hypothetical protein
LNGVQFQDIVRRIESTGVEGVGVDAGIGRRPASISKGEITASAIKIADEQMAQPMKSRSLLGLAKTRLGRVPVAIIAGAGEGL